MPINLYCSIVKKYFILLSNIIATNSETSQNITLPRSLTPVSTIPLRESNNSVQQ